MSKQKIARKPRTTKPARKPAAKPAALTNNDHAQKLREASVGIALSIRDIAAGEPTHGLSRLARISLTVAAVASYLEAP